MNTFIGAMQSAMFPRCAFRHLSHSAYNSSHASNELVGIAVVGMQSRQIGSAAAERVVGTGSAAAERVVGPPPDAGSWAAGLLPFAPMTDDDDSDSDVVRPARARARDPGPAVPHGPRQGLFNPGPSDLPPILGSRALVCTARRRCFDREFSRGHCIEPLHKRGSTTTGACDFNPPVICLHIAKCLRQLQLPSFTCTCRRRRALRRFELHVSLSMCHKRARGQGESQLARASKCRPSTGRCVCHQERHDQHRLCLGSEPRVRSR